MELSTPVMKHIPPLTAVAELTRFNFLNSYNVPLMTFGSRIKITENKDLKHTSSKKMDICL